jgi:hypothetical protein
MDFIVVYTAFSPIDAELVWSRLDAAGFKAEIVNELSSLSMEGYSLSTGGIQIRVPAEQATDAKAFLQSTEESMENDESP